MNALFYISAAVAVISTFMVITRTNAVHSLLYLIVSLLSAALIFFTLGAPFVAALEVIIYAGAIMVLFVFVIMMLNLGPQAVKHESQWFSPSAWVGPAALSAVLLAEIFTVLSKTGGKVYSVTAVEAKEVGIALFGPYIIGVELASMLLLAGVTGAYYLGRKESKEKIDR